MMKKDRLAARRWTIACFMVIMLEGSFRNELKIENTLDPTPHLGLSLNASQNPNRVITCSP
jgi:hypothetical protein